MGTATRTRAMARAWYHSRGGRGRRMPSKGLRPGSAPQRLPRLRRGRRALGDGLSQELVDALDQLPRAERLRDVVVRAHVKSQLLIDVSALRGEEDYRDVLGRGARLDVLADLVSVKLRHHDVQHDEVRLFG